MRYERNKNLISEKEQSTLFGVTISIVGLGGLGGYIAEECARLGIGCLKLVDSDKFEFTNLNRQLYSMESNIGKEKIYVALERISKVNSDIKVLVYNSRLNEENQEHILKGSHLVFGAVDNIETRITLEKACKRLGITLIDGAIGGWYGQISIVKPGEDTLSRIYSERSAGHETELGNPSFICAVVASIQVAEGIKELLFKQEVSNGKVLTVDMLNHCYEKLEI